MISIFGNNKKPESNKSKSIFNKSSGTGALRSDLKKEFMHMTDKTQYGHIMKPWEKAHLAEDLFPSKYGEHVSAGEVDKKIKELSRLKFVVKDPVEKTKYQDRIDFLKKLQEK